MRVISGCAKGHKLKTVEGINTRPTADRVKEALFNIIASYVSGARVLDLFAGSGSLGIEALSRGAEHVDFIDFDNTAAGIIQNNLIHTKLDKQGKVYRCDWNNFLNNFCNHTLKYDIIFVDPPYGEKYLESVLDKLYNKKLLSKEGIIVIENDKDNLLPKITDEFTTLDNRQYGRTSITILTS